MTEPRDRDDRQVGDEARVVVHGLIWTTLTTVAAKGASFVAQIVLGWIFAEEDFALYALAIGISGIVGILNQNGAGRILMQDGASYERRATPILRIGRILALAAALTIVLLAPAAARLYEAQALPQMLWIIALSMILSPQNAVYRAKLSIDSRFRSSAQLALVTAVIRHGSTIVLATLGVGYMSFVYPLLIATVVDWALLRMVVGPIPRPGQGIRQILRTTWRSMIWIMLGALAGLVTLHGDYLVIGTMVDKAVLGVYFFGYQLAASVQEMFTGGFRSVVMPSLARRSGESPNRTLEFRKAVRLVVLVAAPICIGGALATPGLVSLCWAGKWDSATPVIQILLVVLMARLLMPLSIAALEAQGRWRASTRLMWMDAVGVILAAYLGATAGSATTIAVAIAVNQVVVSMIACLTVVIADKQTLALVRDLAAPTSLATALGLLMFFLKEVDSTRWSRLSWEAVKVTLFAILYYLGLRMWMRDRLLELYRVFRADRASQTT